MCVYVRVRKRVNSFVSLFPLTFLKYSLNTAAASVDFPSDGCLSKASKMIFSLKWKIYVTQRN